MLRPNRLKHKLARGEPAYGCWVFLAGDGIEVLALAGFDAIVIDHEHIAADMSELVRQMRCAAVSDTTILVRLPSIDVPYIKRVLDAGVEGIIAPTIETAEDARSLVAACRYRPHGGVRGVGYPIARAARWGLAEAAYPDRYREELLIGGIVETRKGIDNLDAILGVDGLDLVCPGAGDLAADVVTSFDQLGGAYGSYANSELARMVDDAEASIKRSGRKLWGVGRRPDHARALLAHGYDFVTVTGDSWLLLDGARNALAALHADRGPPR
jgi:4-hydroxy-2-oxoheptanedioate aldolase